MVRSPELPAGRSPEIWLAWLPAGRSPDPPGSRLAAGSSPDSRRSLLSGLNNLVSRVTFNSSCPWGILAAGREISGEICEDFGCLQIFNTLSIDKRGNTTTTTKAVLEHYYRAYQKSIEKKVRSLSSQS